MTPPARPQPDSSGIEFVPLTPERFGLLERLFGPRGACSGCWCMWWRLTRREFELGQGNGNREKLRELVRSGEVPGILALDGEQPVGWCSVAPRESFGTLSRSRVLKPLDDRPVWSIVCFFVARAHRGRGLTRLLIRAAVEHVRSSGGRLVEAYPTAPRGRRLPAVSSFMGVPELFEREGFVECARPSEARVILRREIAPGAQSP